MSNVDRIKNYLEHDEFRKEREQKRLWNKLTRGDQKLIRIAVLAYVARLKETNADKELIDIYERLSQKLKEITPDIF